ncbi:MAG TPA: CaiB/BaiF CoA-transferase family protein [Stellaceae bacterium]|nr:CaiB/BaiF CoA-transferase family protein [Stellaceae bacterium]
MKALSDLLVLDFTHVLAGPYATMLLADLGARVVKIEPPGEGEGTRKLLANDPEHSVEGMGAYFLTLNRNKRSVAIDLKSEAGRALVHRLAEKADVAVNNFARGVPERLGIDHGALSARNPRIVTCAITGFGETGPGADRAAFDLVAQGMGGGMSITGEPGGRPLRAGIPIGDLGSGLFAALGILAALHARELTGRGQHVDISMLDGQISLLNYIATMALLSGRNPVALGNAHGVHVPYDTFETTTRPLILAIISDNFWTALVEELDAPALSDPALATQPGRLARKDFVTSTVQAALSRESCETWLQRLGARRIPCAPVNDVLSALADPQVLARHMVATVDHPSGRRVRMPGNAVKLSDTHEERFAPPPRLGEHTDAVLSELLGLPAAELAALRAKGTIG